MGRCHLIRAAGQPPVDWKTFRADRRLEQLVQDLHQLIPSISPSTIRFVCSGSSFNQAEDVAAHTCTEEQARNVLLAREPGDPVRDHLEELFVAIFSKHV